MANFRCERLFIMLDETVPGLNHLAAVDVFEFANLHSDEDAEALGVTPLTEFCYAPFHRPKWRPAAEGLKTVRALIDLYEKRASVPLEQQFRPDVLQAKLALLRQVESVLDAADTYDRRFYFAAKDLT